ncbi:MAG: hypothetical protein ACXVCI_13020 [Bdellovibrionota bacterium]
MKYLILCFLTVTAQAAPNPALDGIINVGTRLAPDTLTLDSFNRWVEPIGKDFESAFAPQIFAWYQREKDAPLPPQVAQDPDKIYVDVETAKAQAIALENSGDIPSYTAAGANVYAVVDGNVDQALEAELDVWGKPVGVVQGSTKPAPSPFGARTNWFAPNPLWGSGAFASLEVRKNGGVIHDISDRYVLLVRGSSAKGYDILMQFIGPVGTSETTNVLAIAVIRPLASGKSSFKISSRYQGQSYGFLGEIGRQTIGFSQSRVRGIQKSYVDSVAELRTTGKIKDHENIL